MKILIAGGSGFVGRYLVSHYINQECEVTVLGRFAAKIQKAYGQSVNVLTWSELERQGSASVAEYDLIINLAGAGIGGKRWSKKRRQEIISSRVLTTAKLAKYCAELQGKSPALFNASAIGVYGLQDQVAEGLPLALDETIAIDYNVYPDFLSKVARLWEQATLPAKHAGVRVVDMRFGIVLGRNGGPLKKIVLPFKLFLGGIIGSGRQPFSWISIVDLGRAIDFLYKNEEVSGPVNIVSPHCITQAELAKAIAKIMHRPCFFRVPAFLLRLIYGQLAEELVLNGQHVVPRRLSKLGFKFKQPTIEEALNYSLRA